MKRQTIFVLLIIAGIILAIYSFSAKASPGDGEGNNTGGGGGGGGTCQPTGEICNQKDDDCDGSADEGGVCNACTPKSESCNGKDDDCDGKVDENNVCNTPPPMCTRNVYSDSLNKDVPGIADKSDTEQQAVALQLCKQAGWTHLFVHLAFDGDPDELYYSCYKQVQEPC